MSYCPILYILNDIGGAIGNGEHLANSQGDLKEEVLH